ncbi:MAG: hypothetical protein QM758_06085 [Armatimonas sp.]
MSEVDSSRSESVKYRIQGADGFFRAPVDMDTLRTMAASGVVFTDTNLIDDYGKRTLAGAIPELRGSVKTRRAAPAPLTPTLPASDALPASANTAPQEATQPLRARLSLSALSIIGWVFVCLGCFGGAYYMSGFSMVAPGSDSQGLGLVGNRIAGVIVAGTWGLIGALFVGIDTIRKQLAR